MNPSEARDHIEMVERIIATSSRKLEAGGEFFVAWGVASAGMGLIATLVAESLLPPPAIWIGASLLLAAVVFTFFRVRFYRECGAGMSLLQREYLNVLWLAVSLAFLMNIVGFNLFPGMGQLAIWNVAEALVLFYIGMHGNRRAQIGGIILVASIVAANFVSQYSGYILAAGVLLGYAGFGVADLLARE